MFQYVLPENKDTSDITSTAIETRNVPWIFYYHLIHRLYSVLFPVISFFTQHTQHIYIETQAYFLLFPSTSDPGFKSRSCLKIIVVYLVSFYLEQNHSISLPFITLTFLKNTVQSLCRMIYNLCSPSLSSWFNSGSLFLARLLKVTMCFTAS